MNDFGKREIFVNLTGMKKFNKKLSIYILCLLLVISIGFFIVDEAQSLLAFLFSLVLFGLMMLWKSYFNNFKTYQDKPYLLLDEIGVTINHKNRHSLIRWQDIKNIDVNLSTIVNDNRPKHHIIQTLDNEIIELNDDLIADKLSETIVLLKHYAQHYGTAKFIYYG